MRWLRLLPLGCAIGLCAPTAAVAKPETEVRALGCHFTIPADYVVIQSDQPPIEFYSETRPGRIFVISLTDPRSEPGPPAREVESSARGPLTIQRYSQPAADADGERSFVIVRGLRDALLFTGPADDVVDAIVASCIATASDLLKKVGKRRDRDCRTVRLERYLAFMAQLNAVPIYEAAGTTGFRITRTGNPAGLEALGLRRGDILKMFCGMSVVEITRINSDLCCTSPVAETVQLSVERHGKLTAVEAPMPPE